jgi:3'-phosphoadenosine 5'-phosphosulfate (PAPS) 3'-phosphatase
MAGGGYRGILAAVPPAQRLRSASGKGATDQNQKPKQKPKQRQRQRQRQDQQLREQVESSHRRSHIKQFGVQLLLLTTHQAER